MLPSTREIIGYAVAAIITIILTAIFQEPLSKGFNRLFNPPSLGATLVHDGYRKEFFVLEESTNVKFRVYPIDLEITNTGKIPLSIKSVIPYMVDKVHLNKPRFDVLYNNQQERFDDSTIMPGESRKITSRAYIRDSVFAIGSTYPKGHKIQIETEVKILGNNKISKFAKVDSLLILADGRIYPNPLNEKPVDFEEVDIKRI